MAPRPRWWHQLQNGKQEALLAVDLFNRVDELRRLEGFIIHMQIAWLYVLQARFARDGVDYWYRSPGGRRVRGKDGEFRAWSLQDSLEHEYPDPNHPVRLNVEFFVGLRNRIEHRSSTAIEPMVAGKCQSLIVNFEQMLTDQFGASEGLADRLRFPLFVSSLTTDAVAALKETYKRMPRKVARYVEEFDAPLSEDIKGDQRYEFRVLLIPKTGPPSKADVAMQFVRLDQLSEQQRAELTAVQTIVRDKQVPVAHLDHFKPSQVCARVEAALGVRFSPYAEHMAAWKHFSVRPTSGTSDPSSTDARYCVYDAAHQDYLYTQAWIDKLIRELSSPEQFELVAGHAPIAIGD